MTRVTLALAVLALVPSVAAAQRRTMGERDVNWNAVAAAKAPPTLTVKDVEGMNPVKLLLEKKKDLKLTDEQLTALTGAEAKLAETNAALLHQVDSLGKEMRPRTSVQGAEDQARMAIARDAMGDVLRSIQANYAGAEGEAMAVLTDAQKPVAERLLAKQREETQKTLRQKMAGARGMGPGMGPGGGGRRPPVH